MFSGKTTELIRRIRRCAARRRTLTLKPIIDDRYSPTDVVTHDGGMLPAQTVRAARQILDRVGTAEVVAVDEVHFFDESLVEVCTELAGRGITVICSGLDRDLWGRPFAHIARLSALAETTVLHGTCAVCRKPADRTQRTTPLLDDNLVGGAADFEPRCAACFHPPEAARPGGAIPGIA